MIAWFVLIKNNIRIDIIMGTTTWKQAYTQGLWPFQNANRYSHISVYHTILYWVKIKSHLEWKYQYKVKSVCFTTLHM